MTRFTQPRRPASPPPYAFGVSARALWAFLAVLAVLEAHHWKKEATALGLNSYENNSLDAPTARQMALGRIRKALASFPAYAAPRAIWMTLEPWTIDNGLITPTLKLKRPAIEQRFAEQIRQLYDRHA